MKYASISRKSKSHDWFGLSAGKLPRPKIYYSIFSTIYKMIYKLNLIKQGPLWKHSELIQCGGGFIPAQMLHLTDIFSQAIKITSIEPQLIK